MMRTSQDPDADAFHARFAPDGVAIEGAEEAALGVMIDFDADGGVVGLEVLSAGSRGQKATPAAETPAG